MRTGVILPSFRADADAAFAAAGQAAAAGLDGVFCYDHLWPMGQPERPALAPFPLLAAIARANPGSGWARSWRASAWCPTTSWWPSSTRSPPSPRAG